MLRVLKLGVYDAAYIDDFYAARPDLAAAPYAHQHRALIEDRASSSDFWTAALARRGHDTADLIANAAPLQRRWAEEQGAAAGLFETAAAQIKSFAPDVLLVADTATFGADFLRAIRADCPSLRLIVGWCGAPYRDLAPMREWDIALSCIPELAGHFRAQGIEAHHVDHGFDPRVLDQLGPRTEQAIPFSFLGSVVKAAGYHEAREALLVRLIQETPLDIRTRLAPPARGPKALAKRLLKRGAPVHPLIRARARPPLYGLAMFRALRDSAVTLNSHIDLSPRSASNMRMFEATGVGACLLTDHKENISALFEPDAEVVTYASPEEAVEKYRYLAARPDVRSNIAAAGQRRALKDHGFDVRAARIDEILTAALKAQ